MTSNNLKRMLIVSAMIVAAIAAIFGFAFGRYFTIQTIGASPAQMEDYRKNVNTIDAKLKNYTDRLNNALLERDVALVSAEEIGKKNRLLERDNTDLQAVVEDYRQVISVRGGLPLTIQKLAVDPLPENVFEYRLDLAQAKRGLRSTGTVAMKLIAGERKLTIPMANNRFNLMDSQRLAGRWTMPKSFQPQVIEIILTQGLVATEYRYAWSLGDVVAHLPDTYLEYVMQTSSPAAQKAKPADEVMLVEVKPATEEQKKTSPTYTEKTASAAKAIIPKTTPVPEQKAVPIKPTTTPAETSQNQPH